MDGWLKLHRKFRDWEWYKDINTKAVFLELLLITNIRDCKFRGQTIPRGSVLVTYDDISESVSLTKDEVRTAVKRLRSSHTITTQKYLNKLLVTVCNYSDYQTTGSHESHTNDTLHPTRLPRVPHESHTIAKISHANSAEFPTQIPHKDYCNYSDYQTTGSHESHTNDTLHPTQDHGNSKIFPHLMNKKIRKELYDVDNARTRESDMKKIRSRWEELVGASYPTSITREFLEYLGHMDSDVIIDAICKTESVGTTNFNYTRSILESHKNKGVRTMDDVRREDRVFEQRKGGGADSGRTSTDRRGAGGDSRGRDWGDLGSKQF